MADSRIVHVRRDTQEDVPEKMVDIGGGLYSRAIVVEGTAAVSGPLTDTQLRATAVPTSDAGPSWTSAYLHYASADASGGADATAAPTSGQKIVVDDIIVSTGAALTVTFEEETTGTDMLVLYLPANGVAQVTPRGKLKLATADKKLRVKASGAGNIACTVFYHSEV